MLCSSLSDSEKDQQDLEKVVLACLEILELDVKVCLVSDYNSADKSLMCFYRKIRSIFQSVLSSLKIDGTFFSPIISF